MKISQLFSRAQAMVLAASVGLLVPMLTSVASAQSDQPHALVISNQRFDEGSRIRNVLVDGRDIAAELQTLGYQVSRVENADASRMQAALATFLAESSEASQRLVYYGGLSLNLDGQTFLAGTDASIDQPFDIITDFVSLSDLVLTLKAGEAPGLVIVNAGFKNSLDGQASAVFGDGFDVISDTLGQPIGSDDVFVLQSQTSGKSTPKGRRATQFVDQLLNAMARDADAPIAEASQSMANQVAATTSNQQVPQFSSSFVGNSTFANARLAPLVDPIELAAFEDATAANNVIALDDFLRSFPNSSFAAEAEDTRAALLNAMGYQPETKSVITRRTANTRTGPSTNFAIVEQLKGGERLTEVGRVNRGVWAYVRFETGQSAFIYGSLIEAFDAEEYNAWQALSGTTSIEALQDFLIDYPGGRYKAEAQEELAALYAEQRRKQLRRLRVTPINELFYVAADSPFYDFPGADGASLGKFDALQKLTVIGKVQRRHWFEVAINEGRGFMRVSRLLEYAGSDFEAWEEVKETQRVRALERFLNSYPNSQFADLAKERIEALTPRTVIDPIEVEYHTTRSLNLRAGPSNQDQILVTVDAYTPILATGTVRGMPWKQVQVQRNGGLIEGFMYEPFLVLYEGSDFQAWEQALSNNTGRAYRRFINRFPGSPLAVRAEEKIGRLERRDGKRLVNAGGLVYSESPLYLRETPDDSSAFTKKVGPNQALSLTAKTADGRWAKAVFIDQEKRFEGFVLAAALLDYEGSDLAIWTNAQNEDSKQGYQRYLRLYPNGKFVSLARKALADNKRVGVEELAPKWRVISKDNAVGRTQPRPNAPALVTWRAQDKITVSGISSNKAFYRVDFNGQPGFVAANDTADFEGSERSDWENVLRRNSRQGWEFYLRKYPNGRWTNEARQRLSNQRDPGLQLFLKLGEEILKNRQ